MFLVVAAVGFGVYYVITHYINPPAESVNAPVVEESGKIIIAPDLSFDQKLSQFSSGGYTDPKKRFWIRPPANWKLVDKDLMMKAGEQALPSNLKDWVKPQNVDVMFMDLSTPGQFGSNLNIMIVDPAYDMEINDSTFGILKIQVQEEYMKMNLEDFHLLNAEIKNVSKRNCAYFELTFKLLGNDLRIIQLMIPGKTAMTILTYTLSTKFYDDDVKKRIESSYNSYFSNSEKGF